jgi:hypothetical protein
MGGQVYDRCHKCGCPCFTEVEARSYYRACEACGFWLKERYPRDGESDDKYQYKEGGGKGVVAYTAKGDKGLCWCALNELGVEPFTAEELDKLEWAWVSRPRPDGRWEGVLLKGEPRDQWRGGLLPLYEEFEE